MLNSIIFIYISHRGTCKTKLKPSQTFGAEAALKNSVKSTTWLCKRCDRRAEHNWLWVPANFFQCVQLRLRPTVEFSEWVNRYKNCIQYYVVLVCQLMECNVFTVCWTSHITEIKKRSNRTISNEVYTADRVYDSFNWSKCENPVALAEVLKGWEFYLRCFVLLSVKCEMSV